MPFFERRLSFQELLKANWPIFGLWLAVIQCQQVVLRLLEIEEREKLKRTDDRRWFVEASPLSNGESFFTFEVVGLIFRVDGVCSKKELRWPLKGTYDVRNPQIPFTVQDLLKECTLSFPLIKTAQCIDVNPVQEEDSPVLFSLFDSHAQDLLLYQVCKTCLILYGSHQRKFWVPGFRKWVCFECLVSPLEIADPLTPAMCLIPDCTTASKVSVWVSKALENQAIVSPFFMCQSHKQNSKRSLETFRSDDPTEPANLLSLPFLCSLYAKWLNHGVRNVSSDTRAVSMISDNCLWFLASAACAFFHCVSNAEIKLLDQMPTPWTNPFIFDHAHLLFPSPVQPREDALAEFREMMLHAGKQVVQALKLLPVEDPYKIDREADLLHQLREQRQFAIDLESQLRQKDKRIEDMKKAEEESLPMRLSVKATSRSTAVVDLQQLLDTYKRANFLLKKDNTKKEQQMLQMHAGAVQESKKRQREYKLLQEEQQYSRLKHSNTLEITAASSNRMLLFPDSQNT